MRLFQSFTRVRWIAAMPFALACVPVLGACGSSSSGTEVGTGTTSAATVTTVERVVDDLTLLVGVTPGWEAVIDPWRAAVGEQSDGQLRAVLDLAWQDAHKRQQVELDIVDAVANGDLDIGYVGSRAFNALGVSDFDGLTAPFLVDSYELQDTVLDSDMPARMLAKVEPLGVSGLALVAGPLRYPLGIERPLLEPTDFAGITFHTWPSATNAATAAALGSTHVDMFGVERDDAIDAGTIDATENSLTWMYNNGRASYATIDAPLWPATGVLIANPDMLSRLSTDQRAALQQAIDEALPRRADLAETDAAVIVDLSDWI